MSKIQQITSPVSSHPIVVIVHCISVSDHLLLLDWEFWLEGAASHDILLVPYPVTHETYRPLGLEQLRFVSRHERLLFLNLFLHCVEFYWLMTRFLLTHLLREQIFLLRVGA